MSEINQYAQITGNCIAASEEGPMKILTGRTGACIKYAGDCSVVLLDECRIKVPDSMLEAVGNPEEMGELT